MPAPELSFSSSGVIVSAVDGYDHITVTFSAAIAYTEFQCRATRQGESYGVGIGALIASFSSTPAGTVRSYDIYDTYLTSGDGEYRISLFARGEDGSWNDNEAFIPSGSDGMTTADGAIFLSMR